MSNQFNMPPGTTSRWRAQCRWVLLCLTLILRAATEVLGVELPPAAPPPSPVVLPTPAAHQLPNGLQVVVIERRSLPLVTLRLVVKSGAAADPQELPGVAEMVATLLSQGTSKRRALDISESIDRVGGAMESAAEWDNSYASLTVLSDHTELAFDILADIATRPTFPPEEVDRRRKQTLSALEILFDDPPYVADQVFDLLVFAGTPYGHLRDGTPESLARMTRRELSAFHGAHYRPENSILALVGDLSEENAIRLAEKFFGTWERGQGRPEPRKIKAQEARPRVVVIDKPDAVQTEIRVGTRGVPRGSPDYEALTVVNQILGGPATNRLFKTLRSRQGLAYGASSDLVCNRSLGSWVAKTSTRTAGTGRALAMILEQMKNLRNRPISGAELRTAQSYLLGHMALEFETPESVAAHTLELMVHGLPLNSWNRFAEKVKALRTEEVFAATRRCLGAPGNTIVLVGDAHGFRADLKKLGPQRIIPIRDLDFGGALAERQAGSEAGR
ncbi:MAG: insulinase family protein [Acidobacteria bacterium]|nr:insulinase family protein [Acidobacteriota bacterium]